MVTPEQNSLFFRNLFVQIPTLNCFILEILFIIFITDTLTSGIQIVYDVVGIEFSPMMSEIVHYSGPLKRGKTMLVFSYVLASNSFVFLPTLT